MDSQEKKARLTEAAAVLLNTSPDQRLKIVVLNKALFYADLVCLRDFGKTFTGNTYVALQQGPVVANYKRRLVKPMETAGTAEWIEDGDSKPLKLLKMPELTFCQGDWFDVVEDIGQKFNSFTSAKVSKVSHNNLGWKLAWRRGGATGGTPKPVDLNIAMQQLQSDDDDEAWITADLNEKERDAVEAAEAGGGVEW